MQYNTEKINFSLYIYIYHMYIRYIYDSIPYVYKVVILNTEVFKCGLTSCLFQFTRFTVRYLSQYSMQKLLVIVRS